MLLKNLKAIAATASQGKHIPPAELAAAFGWEAARIRERQIHADGRSLDVVRGYSGVQPAALFTTTQEGRAPAIELAAFYGYHASVRWGVLADNNGLTAFNSHWLDRDQWFTFPIAGWGDLDDNRTVLEAFQPRQVIDGVPDRIALERNPAPTLLQPVDDELVDRLDVWREQALKTSRSEHGVDEQLQTLFAKLFVLRTIEDRNLAPSVAPLISALARSDQLNTHRLIDIFGKAKAYIGSELFDAIDLSLLPEYVIAGVIRDLYHPHKISLSDKRYNFSWIDSDVLGLAYEKYLSTVLQPATPKAQLDFFHGSIRDVDRISVRKAGGVYYTPAYLTKYLADKCVNDYFDKAGNYSTLPRVIDFSCGSGSFLVAALDALLRRLKSHDPQRDWGRELIDGGYLNGVDIDEKAVTVARLNLWNRLAEEPNPLPLPKLSQAVVQGDGLDTKSWGALNQRYDVVLGNPPFLATARVNNRTELESRFRTAKGRYDFSYLFVEQAINVTAPSGRFGMVVPNRLFRNHNAGAIRSEITSAMDLLTIVDFGSNEVFQGASAYVGCIVARHRELLSPPASSVQVIDVKTLPDQFVAAFLVDAENLKEVDAIRVYTAQHPRGPGVWALLSSREKLSQVQFSDASVRLSEIAGIFQGIRTGANDIFILEAVADDEQFVAQISNGLGDSAILERGLLRPVVFGSDVRRYGSLESRRYLLYPYEGGIALTEAEMEKKYPLTLQYLIGYRDILSARTSIVSSGLRWYDLVRRRDTDWLQKPKLLIRDLAPETAFAVDPEGKVFIVGGTAVVPEYEELLMPLLAYLNSKPINSLMRRVTPQFRGGFQKFEPQHLQQIPVLHALTQDASFCEQLAMLAGQASDEGRSIGERDTISAEIDAVVAQAMISAGIDPVN